MPHEIDIVYMSMHILTQSGPCGVLAALQAFLLRHLMAPHLGGVGAAAAAPTAASLAAVAEAVLCPTPEARRDALLGACAAMLYVLVSDDIVELCVFIHS